MTQQATLVNKTTGQRVAVATGSQDAQKYFGQGYELETQAPAPVSAPAAAAAAPTPAPTAANAPPTSGTGTVSAMDATTAKVTDPVAKAPITAAQTPTPTDAATATQIRNIDELNKLSALGLNEGDITRQGSAIFLKPGINEDALRQRSVSTNPATTPTTAAAVTDSAPTAESQVENATKITEAQKGLETFSKFAPDRAKILEDTFKRLGLTGANDLYANLGTAANKEESALRDLPNAIKERTERVGVTNRQLNRLVATEAEPIAQALKDLLQSRSIVGDQIAFGFQQAEFQAKGEEDRFTNYTNLLSSAGLAIDPTTGAVGSSYAANQDSLNRQERLDVRDQERLDSFNSAQGYVKNPETGQLVPTFERTKWLDEHGIPSGVYNTNTSIQSTGEKGNFGLNLLQTSGGNRADRNNNPLNVKASSYTSGFGGVLGAEQSSAADGGNFLVFDSPEAGFAAAQELWRNGKSYQGVSVDTALRRWSGGGYGGELATRAGIDPTRGAQSLSDDELHALQQEMAKREGFSGKKSTTKTDPSNLSPEQEEKFKAIQDDLNSNIEYKNINSVQQGFDSVRSGVSLDNGFGDLAAINGFQKMVDPGASVREGEFQTVSDAQGFLKKFFNTGNQVAKGDKLTTEARQQLETAAANLYNNKANGWNSGWGKTFASRVRSAGIPEDFAPVTLPSYDSASKSFVNASVENTPVDFNDGSVEGGYLGTLYGKNGGGISDYINSFGLVP